MRMKVMIGLETKVKTLFKALAYKKVYKIGSNLETARKEIVYLLIVR